jgi:hypothetical protein
VQRTSGVVSAFIDGMPAGSMPMNASLGALPRVKVQMDPCVGADGTIAFVGTVTNVCVGVP